MKASELIYELQRLMAETGSDPEVGAQSSGCCYHAHEILTVGMGGVYRTADVSREKGMIVIRV
jgi:hypothetical protein